MPPASSRRSGSSGTSVVRGAVGGSIGTPSCMPRANSARPDAPAGCSGGSVWTRFSSSMPRILLPIVQPDFNATVIGAWPNRDRGAVSCPTWRLTTAELPHNPGVRWWYGRHNLKWLSIPFFQGRGCSSAVQRALASARFACVPPRWHSVGAALLTCSLVPRVRAPAMCSTMPSAVPSAEGL